MGDLIRLFPPEKKPPKATGVMEIVGVITVFVILACVAWWTAA